MLFDTHCHLDASEFDHDRAQVIERAQAAGVQVIVIPAVEVANFDRVRLLAHSFAQGFYALGIHPMYVERATPKALEHLREALQQHRSDPKLIAVGEIGLDFFIPEIAQGEPRAKQERFYEAQLKLALEFDLPVLLHVRRSQDTLLKYLRRHRVRGGIAHAFNGSLQQAQQFVELGFALGVGGAMTFDRALQIRRLATELGLSALVLETDAPDISPGWLAKGARNEPCEVLRIAQTLAELRQCSVVEVLRVTAEAARRVCPGLVFEVR
ncbi:MAG: TatD family hydrolase [Alcaligenaceae bacterium]